MARQLFLNIITDTFKTHKNNSALVFGQDNQQFCISYATLGKLSSDLYQFLKQIFTNERVYICLNIKTRLCLLPLFISLWKNNLAAVNLKDKDDLKKCMEILNTKYLITDEACDFKLKTEFLIMGCRLFIYELHTEPLRTFPVGWDMCYALCTSGSTGTPKLVQVPWECIYPNVTELADIWEINHQDVIAWSAPYTFDPFFIELMASVITGACLFLTESSKSEIKNSIKVSNVRISVLQTTPSIFKSKIWDLSELRLLILGGEIFPQFFKIPDGVRVFNIYGITEVSCWSFMREIEKEGEDSIGKPLTGIIYKIEENELWIGSKNRKCLVEREDPRELPELLFRRTGDLVENLENLRVVDRANNVVKIFGSKISLTDVYSHLFKEHGDFCVVFDETSHTLGLFLVEKNLEIDYQRIESNFIVERHPELKPIQRPDVVYKVGKLPLNGHGKIDFNELRKILRRKFENSEKSVEKTFERLWCQLLGLSAVVPGKSFTQCGGESVTGLKLLNQLAALNISVPSSFFTKLLGPFSFEDCCELIEKREIEIVSLEDESRLSIRWSFDMKKCIDSSPSFIKIDGIWCVCVGSHSSQISLLECQNGRHLWTVFLGDRIESGIAVSLNQELLFTGCYDQHIYCLKARTGEIIWKFRTGAMIKSTPRISDDGCFLFCGSYDKQMYCLNAQNGSIITSISCSGSILSTPVLTKTLLIFGTLSGDCCAVKCDSFLSVWSNKLQSPIFSSPCLINNASQILFAEVKGCIHCFEINTGKRLWKFQCNGNIFSGLTAVISETPFVTFGCHDRHIYLLDVQSHEPVVTLKIPLDSPIACAPSATKQYLACVSSAGFLYIIDLVRQAITSRLKIGGETFASPQWHGTSLYLGSRDDHLLCVDFNKNT